VGIQASPDKMDGLEEAAQLDSVEQLEQLRRLVDEWGDVCAEAGGSLRVTTRPTFILLLLLLLLCASAKNSTRGAVISQAPTSVRVLVLHDDPPSRSPTQWATRARATVGGCGKCTRVHG
jgi:hypothetical protein